MNAKKILPQKPAQQIKRRVAGEPTSDKPTTLREYTAPETIEHPVFQIFRPENLVEEIIEHSSEQQTAQIAQEITPLTLSTTPLSTLSSTQLFTPSNTPLLTPSETPLITPPIEHQSGKLLESTQIWNDEETNQNEALIPSPDVKVIKAKSGRYAQKSQHTSPAKRGRATYANDAEELRNGEVEPFVPLDATHSNSEQKIYSVMYRKTISKGIREYYFGFGLLSYETGIRSPLTVRTALRALVEKLSIEIVSYVVGHPLGVRYRVFSPQEIQAKRKQAGIVIDPQSKKIVERDSTPSATPLITPSNTLPTAQPTTPLNAPIAPLEINGVDEATPLEIDGVTPSKIDGQVNNKNNTSSGHDLPLSSSSNHRARARANDDDDEEKIAFVQSIYEEATSNQFTATDLMTLQQASDIPARVWGYSICVCVDRSPGHQFKRLSYVLEQAKNDWESYKEQGIDKDERMQEMMLRMSLKRIKQARESGEWLSTSKQSS